jgi:hypothetical protein
MAKQKSSTTLKRTWRDNPDRLHRGFPAWPSPESLHPTEDTMMAAITGDESARAIICSYAACRYSYPMEVRQ